MSAQDTIRLTNNGNPADTNTSDRVDEKDVWKRVLAELEATTNLGPVGFNTIFTMTKVISAENGIFELIAPNDYVRKILEKKFIAKLEDTIAKISRTYFKVKISINSNVVIKDTVAYTEPLFQTISKNEQKPEVRAPIHREFSTNSPKSNLSSKFTFENYLMGNNNQLAFAIATAVAREPGKTYNPFFLYSGVGLGKTHLMQAIGNKILEQNPNAKIIYSTGETFTNELIESIQSGKGGRGKYTSNEFRDKYRKADVLLVDDIQFIAGREATQEEFFHTFNALYMAQKQIVVTSDRPPKDFKNLEERITSRFGSGIIADIQPPDIDMRVAILRTKRDRNNDAIPNEVLEYIAEKISTNVRELEGAYLQVLTLSTTLGQEATLETAAKALGQSIREEKTKPLNLNTIIKAVCNYYSVNPSDIKGKDRSKEIVIPRQVAMYLMYKLTGTPFMTIGEMLGGRDHTTIMHGVKKIEEEVTNIEKTKQDILNVKQIISRE